MQSLHRGSFCVCRYGEKPVEGRDTRRNAQWSPWNFSPYLDVVYYKALSGTYQKIHLSAQKVLASTYRRIFG